MNSDLSMMLLQEQTATLSACECIGLGYISILGHKEQVENLTFYLYFGDFVSLGVIFIY